MNEKALLYLYGWIEGTIGERLFSFTDFKLAAAHAEEASDKVVVTTLHAQDAPAPLGVVGGAVEPAKKATWQTLQRASGLDMGDTIRLKSNWKEICDEKGYGVSTDNIEYEPMLVGNAEYSVEYFEDDGATTAPLQLYLADQDGGPIPRFWTEYELWEILR